jgi:hypothetical protein
MQSELDLQAQDYHAMVFANILRVTGLNYVGHLASRDIDQIMPLAFAVSVMVTQSLILVIAMRLIRDGGRR